MVIIWLLVWLIQGFPEVTIDPWNTWAVALAVCATASFIGAIARRAED